MNPGYIDSTIEKLISQEIPLTSGGSGGASTSTFTASNTTGSTIAAFKAVASNGGASLIKLADSGTVNDFPVIGFTTTSIASSGTGPVQTGGILSGFTGLTAGSVYFSDPATPGGITATVPTTDTSKSQVVGRAISTTALLIEISEPITVSSTSDFVARNSTTGRLGENFAFNAAVLPLYTSSGSTLGIQVTPANPGGALALQAATPGSSQTSANGHIDGTFIADTLLKSPTVNGSTTVQVNGTNLNPTPKNWLINGNMEVNQRFGPGGSAANVQNGQFGLDRWALIRDGTGATASLGQVAFTLGQTAVPGEPTYFLEYNHTVAGSGSVTTGVVQSIEDVRTLAGQQATLSFWAKADAARSTTVLIRQNFGSGGSASVDLSTIVNLTTSWQKFTYSPTLGSISGKTLGTAHCLQVFFLCNNVNIVQKLDIAQAQLEAGANAGAFQKKTFAEELRDCKRYYQKTFAYATAPADNAPAGNYSQLLPPAIGGVFYFQSLALEVAMRTAPNGTIYNPSSTTTGQVHNYTRATSSTACSLNAGGCTEKTIQVQVTAFPAGWAANDLYGVHVVLTDPSL